MATARKQQICLFSTPYYHITGRCVRRAFLCGKDIHSGVDYSHRRQWVVDRLSKLIDVFSIQVCSYAVMSNHYHLVIDVDQDTAQSWSAAEVIRRWKQVYSVPDWVEEDLYHPGQKVREQVYRWINKRRQRLCSISWFMRCLNEYIARRANKEDNCTGAFWEGRFKSRALLSEQALISCMVYVDLNPIRAKMASSLEDSDFTSIQVRTRTIKAQKSMALKSFSGQNLDNSLTPIPFRLEDYVNLVQWTATSCLNLDKQPSPARSPSLLEQLSMAETKWLRSVNLFSNPLYRALGPLDLVRAMARQLGKHWFFGMRSTSSLFRKP